MYRSLTPALDGQPVTVADVRLCTTEGHMSYVVDGVDQHQCPRCGESTAEPTADQVGAIGAEVTIMVWGHPVAGVVSDRMDGLWLVSVADLGGAEVAVTDAQMAEYLSA